LALRIKRSAGKIANVRRAAKENLPAMMVPMAQLMCEGEAAPGRTCRSIDGDHGVRKRANYRRIGIVYMPILNERSDVPGDRVKINLIWLRNAEAH